MYCVPGQAIPATGSVFRKILGKNNADEGFRGTGNRTIHLHARDCCAVGTSELSTVAEAAI